MNNIQNEENRNVMDAKIEIEALEEMFVAYTNLFQILTLVSLI